MSNASPPRNLPSILRSIERTYLVSVFLSMVILFFVNIVVRTLTPQSASDLAWVEEAVRLLNLFLVFGGLGLALERGRHVSIDSLRDTLPQPLAVCAGKPGRTVTGNLCP